MSSTGKKALLTRKQRRMLAQVAETWLEMGARSFGYSINGKVIEEWSANGASPTQIDQTVKWVSTQIEPNHEEMGELFVTGLNGPSNFSRLKMDAMFLSDTAKMRQDIDAISHELVQNQDQIVTLHQLAKTMRRHLDIEPLISSLTKTLLNLFNTEYLVTLMSVGNLSPIANEYPTTQLLDNQLISILQQLHKDGEFQIFNEFAHPKINNMLFLPLEVREPIHTSFAFINKSLGEFQTPDLKLAQMIGDQIGAQFEYVQLHQEVLDKTRLEAEADMARTVQMQLLPTIPPDIRGLDIFAQSKPASQVGGDFYIFMPAAKLPIFVLGDVSGKGMPAALLMTMLRSGFKSAARTAAHEETITQDILNDINSGMYEDFTTVEMFATGVVAAFDPESRELKYSNAGHSPVIYCPFDGPPEILPANGPAMGVVDLDVAGSDSIILRPDDIFIICTDGFNEAWNEAGEMFGYDRLLDLIVSLRESTAMDIGIDLYMAVEDFSDGHTQDDDQTIIVLKGVDDGTK